MNIGIELLIGWYATSLCDMNVAVFAAYKVMTWILLLVGGTVVEMSAVISIKLGNYPIRLIRSQENIVKIKGVE